MAVTPSQDTDNDWSARHARTGASEPGRLVEVPDEPAADWDLRHAETKGRD